ncbi:hypothetical protein Bca4012_003068 [Brassica carinata]|uniref:Uncharacterized protein n=1 Tax=Brassica oleracea var. oleracea TaxID=109376 RepID=A0A0D3B7V2_BRAOL
MDKLHQASIMLSFAKHPSNFSPGSVFVNISDGLTEMPSLTASDKAMHSASVVDNATTFCSDDLQLTVLPPTV